MAGTTIIMSKLKHIIRLRSNGVQLQTIAKASGLSRILYHFIYQTKKTITKENIPLLQILDTIRYIKKTPDFSIKSACNRIIAILKKIS
ncbi:MAG: hypothetical protein ABI237_15335 [Ginsengibacter sp.]